MKNAARLRAVTAWDVRPAKSPPRTEGEIDLFSLSGYRRQSPIRSLSVLWQRAKQRSELVRALGRARADTEQPHI